MMERQYLIFFNSNQRCQPANTCAKHCFMALKGGGANFNLNEWISKIYISQILLLIEAEGKLRGVEVAKQTEGG